MAGFAKGGAKVQLAEDGGDTLLGYDVKAQVGGKMAQLGARLIDASAKQMAERSSPVQPRWWRRRAAAARRSRSPTPGRRGAGRRPVVAASACWALIPREPFGLPLAA